MAAPKISVYVQPGSDNRTTLNTAYSVLTDANSMKYHVENPYNFGTMEHLESAATTVELSRVIKLWIFNNGTTSSIYEADVTKRISRLRNCELYALSYEIYPDGLRYGTTDISNTDNYLKDISLADESKRIITRHSSNNPRDHEHQEESILDQHWIKAKLNHINNSTSFTFNPDTDYIGFNGTRNQSQSVVKWLSICSEYTLYVRNVSETTYNESTNVKYDLLENSILYGEGNSSLRCAKVTLAIIPPNTESNIATPGSYQFLLCLKGYFT